jgi:hypothetical protein
MEIPLSAFLFAYIVYIAIFLFFTFFNLYHMLKFGFVSFWAYFLTTAYIILTVLALFVSYFYIAQVDWTGSFEVFQVTPGAYLF